MRYLIIRITTKPNKKNAPYWFYNKWCIPEAFQAITEDSINNNTIVPAWYLCLHFDKVTGDLVIIKNNFHNRRKFTANV